MLGRTSRHGTDAVLRRQTPCRTARSRSPARVPTAAPHMCPHMSHMCPHMSHMCPHMSRLLHKPRRPSLTRRQSRTRLPMRLKLACANLNKPSHPSRLISREDGVEVVAQHVEQPVEVGAEVAHPPRTSNVCAAGRLAACHQRDQRATKTPSASLLSVGRSARPPTKRKRLAA